MSVIREFYKPGINMFKVAINLFPKISGKLTANGYAYNRRHNYFTYFKSKRVTLRSNQCFCSSPLISSNGIYTSTFDFAKHFVENENKYAYSILKNSEAYCENLSYNKYLMEELTVSEKEFNDLCRMDWSNETAESIYLGFKKLSFYSSENPQTVSDEKFNNIVKALVEKCAQLNDEDLIAILAYLRKWSPTPSAKSPNYIELWKAIDEQCTARMSKWDRNKLLFVADHWYLINLATFPEYVWRAIIRLSRRADKLTAAQLVQCMFYINARRKFPAIISVYDIEYRFEKCKDELSIEEIAILAMGFFKSQKPIRSQNLLLGIMRDLMDKVDSIHEISLAALLKVIRYSLSPTNGDTLIALLDKLYTQIDRLPLVACMHISIVGTNILVYHKETIDKVVERFYNEIDSCRLKDLERFSFALSLYNYKHEKVPSIYDLIAEQISKSERSDEIEDHAKCFACCLGYLSQNGIYPEQEISKVLSKKFLVDVYGRNKGSIGREILSLDVGVELECPHYTGNRLDQKTREYLAKIYTDNIWQYEDLMQYTKLNSSNKMLLDVYSSAVAVLGSEKKVHLGHLVPHRERADIVYGLREDGSAVDIPSSFRNLSIGACKKTPDIADTKWYCLIIGGWNTYIRNTYEPVGSLVSKMRHLQILNYNPILIPWFEWRLLPADDQQNYLHKKIFGDVKRRAKFASR